MRTLSNERIKRLEQNGYKTIHVYSNLFLIRKYSKYCTSSIWKRYFPLYCLIKAEDGKYET